MKHRGKKHHHKKHRGQNTKVKNAAATKTPRVPKCRRKKRRHYQNTAFIENTANIEIYIYSIGGNKKHENYAAIIINTLLA